TSPDGYNAWYTINQNNYGNPVTRQGEWVVLGTFYSADGGNNHGWIKIHLSDRSDDAAGTTKIAADAIRFQQASAPPGCPHCSCRTTAPRDPSAEPRRVLWSRRVAGKQVVDTLPVLVGHAVAVDAGGDVVEQCLRMVLLANANDPSIASAR